MNVIFFGSTQDSVIICDALFRKSKQLSITIRTVVTQPAKPIGRKQIVTPTPVERWAKSHAIPCKTFESQKDKPWLYHDEEHVIRMLSALSPDLLISASYGQKIPQELIDITASGGINVHPSLLPRWRGTDPVPWTILSGDAETGVTIVTLSNKFDEGKILAQKKIPLSGHGTPEEIRSHLFTLGATLLVDVIPKYCAGKHTGTSQDTAQATYARRITKEDGFIPWNIIRDAQKGKTVINDAYQDTIEVTKTSLPESIVRAVRAFSPWPGVWSMIPIRTGTKRIKILTVHVTDGNLIIDTVQLEGKKPTDYATFAAAYGNTLDNPST